MNKPKYINKWIDTTGDVVVGDTIKFTEAVFEGSYKNPKYKGDREIEAYIYSESYGKAKQQHSFSI